MRARFADVPSRYPGVSVVYGGENQETEQTIQDMLRALGIALLAIYAILATLVRSYLQPLVVMSVVAFAFIGVTLGLFITGGAKMNAAVFDDFLDWGFCLAQGYGLTEATATGNMGTALRLLGRFEDARRLGEQAARG